MHQIEEDLKRRIKKHYELFDPEEKIYLDGEAKDIIEPAFLEYQKDIINFIKRQNEQIEEQKEIKTSEQLEELEVLSEENETISEEKLLDIEILVSIEKKLNEIIPYFDLNLFSKNEDKERLKEIIVNDMLDRFINFYLTDKMRESIINLVRDNVEHEFKEYALKKKIRIKNLFSELKNNFLNELTNIITNHKNNKIKDIKDHQIKNFLKYLIDFIDKKYIIPFKKEKKLNNEEYLVLKNLSEKFIIKNYNSK